MEYVKLAPTTADIVQVSGKSVYTVASDCGIGARAPRWRYNTPSVMDFNLARSSAELLLAKFDSGRTVFINELLEFKE
jgi:hypothetical protein